MAIEYEKIIWENNVTQLNDDNMNHIENAIEALDTALDTKASVDYVDKIHYGYSGDDLLIIPERTTTIGENAYKGTTYKCVVIPYGVTSIGNGAFYGCPLEVIDLTAYTTQSFPTLDTNNFNSIAANCQIKVVKGRKAELIATSGWSNYVSYVVEIPTVETVDEALETKLDKSNVVQTTGQSTTAVMSQKATTDEINALKSDIVDIIGRDEYVITENAFVNSNNGNVQNNTSGNPFAITGIKVIGGSKIKLTLGSVPYAGGRGCAFYKSDGSSYAADSGNIMYTVGTLEYEIAVPDDAVLFGFTVFGDPTDYIIKPNSINNIKGSINDINGSINDINDSINDINDSIVTNNFDLSNMEKTEGYFVNGVYGTLTSHSEYDCYTISDLSADTKIKIKPNFTHSAVGYVFKDSDQKIKGKGVFNGSATDEYILTVPNGANSLTFTHKKDCYLPVFKMLYTSEEIYKALNKNTDSPLAKMDYTPTYITMFRRIIHIGDSLTRGQYNTTSPDNSGADLPEYSRPAFMQRMCGNVNVNLGIGGATVSQNTSWNWIDVAKANTVFQWSEFENAGDCYIIALGTNDISKFGSFTGDISTDIDTSDYKNNATTSVGCYAKIIQMIRDIQPKAVIFCVTIPQTRNDPSTRRVANTAIKSIAEMFGCYVIDLETYAEQSSNGKFAEYYKNDSHNNALGYNLRARQYIAYIDWIIENNLDDFRNVQFIGTDYDWQST